MQKKKKKGKEGVNLFLNFRFYYLDLIISIEFMSLKV